MNRWGVAQIFKKALTVIQRKRWLKLEKNVFVAGLVSFFMDVSSEMLYPILPLFLANVLGVNKSMIGLIEGIGEATASLVKVFSGWWSDRIGRRKGLMALGYATSTLSRPIIALSSTWGQVLASRFVDRLGKGVRTAPRDAIIAESSAERYLASSFGFHRAMDTLGAVVGPAIGFFFLQHHKGGYQSLFWLSMIPGILAVLTLILFIKEKDRPLSCQAPSNTSSFRKLDLNVQFFCCIAALFAAGNSSDAFLILRAEQIGVPALMIPVVYLMFNLVYSLSSIPSGIMADRFGKKRIILAGFLLFAILYFGFARAESVISIWILFALYGVFMGLTEGIQKAFLAAIIPSSAKATAFGAYATLTGVAALPASFIGGFLWDRVSPAATFYFGSMTATASALLFMVFIFRKGRS